VVGGITVRRRSCAPLRLALILGVLACAGRALAEPDVATAKTPEHVVEGRLLLAIPAALPTGLTTGVEAAYARARGRWLAWGVSAGWGTATEYTLTEIVRNDDLRLRVFGAVQHTAGRGTFGLRLGIGGTLVYEDRTRAQGERAGLTGADLQTSAWSMLPGADLEGFVVLRVLAGWGVALSAGPSLHLVNGQTGWSPRWGWVSTLGVAWLH
jgi:hypothetical protein